MRKFLTGFIVATIILTGSIASAKDFTDTKGHWAEEKINYYSSIGSRVHITDKTHAKTIFGVSNI